jgi:hypothetical protein
LSYRVVIALCYSLLLVRADHLFLVL